jgi:hypothetical protein
MCAKQAQSTGPTHKTAAAHGLWANDAVLSMHGKFVVEPARKRRNGGLTRAAPQLAF